MVCPSFGISCRVCKQMGRANSTMEVNCLLERAEPDPAPESNPFSPRGPILLTFPRRDPQRRSFQNSGTDDRPRATRRLKFANNLRKTQRASSIERKCAGRYRPSLAKCVALRGQEWPHLQPPRRPNRPKASQGNTLTRSSFRRRHQPPNRMDTARGAI